MMKKQTPVLDSELPITPNQLLLAFAGLFLMNLALRIFYIRYDFVNGDEGVRALTAVRMLEGARLYADVVTDKPPGASLFYATVFAMLGRSMKAVHVAAIVWNFATAAMVYLVGARFYTKRIGVLAAFLFVYFSTNYFTQDTMAANTELLMALPYTAAWYFFMVGRAARNWKTDHRGTGLSGPAELIAAGVLTGFAALFKQIGVLNLVFFAAYEILAARRASQKYQADRSSTTTLLWGAFARLSLIGLGFGLVIAVFVLWLRSMGALGDFWRNGILLNMFYIDSEPIDLWIRFMFGRGLGFLFFNATLWLLAGWTVWRSIGELKDGKDVIDQGASADPARFDLGGALWGGVSLVSVMMSGRFFGHYFIPALPALSLLAATSANQLTKMLRDRAQRPKALTALTILGLLFLVGFFRCHHRTAVLAYETVTGS